MLFLISISPKNNVKDNTGRKCLKPLIPNFFKVGPHRQTFAHIRFRMFNFRDTTKRK